MSHAVEFCILSLPVTGYGELLPEISCSRLSVEFATGRTLDQRYGMYAYFM